MTEVLEQRRPIFLILEDTPVDRGKIVQVVTEEGGIPAAVEDVVLAADLAATQRFHCLIVDLHMAQDPEDEPFSGEDLLRRYRGGSFSPPAIVASFYTSEERNERLRRKYPNVIGIVSRGRNPQGWPEDLRPLVRDAIIKTNINWKQQVALQQKLTSSELTSLLLDKVKPTEDDIWDLLGSLFKESPRLHLHPLGGGRSGARTLKVIPEVYSRSRRRLGTGNVIKYGSPSEIRNEFDNYQQYVAPYLGPLGRTTRVEGDPVYTWLLGGIRYSLIETRGYQYIHTFDRYYAEHTTADVLEAVASLFSETCAPWYEDKDRVVFDFARDQYLARPRLQRAKTAFERHFPQYARQLFIELPSVPQTFANPYLHLDQHLASISPENSYVCPVHGDLHSRNILTDGRTGESWLIDFAQTGVLHYFTDLIRLELSVIFELLPENDVTSNIDFFEAILMPPELTSHIELPTSLNSKEAFAKAGAVIEYLRSFAGGLQHPIRETNQYFLALYNNAWTGLSYLGGSFPIEKRPVYLVFLCLLSRRLFGSEGLAR